LGERCVRNAEVEGSTPFRSTSLLFLGLGVTAAAILSPAWPLGRIHGRVRHASVSSLAAAAYGV